MQEFQHIGAYWRWAGPNYARSLGQLYPDGEEGDLPYPNDHGTGILSSILSSMAGHNLGVAKDPYVIVDLMG